MRADNLDQVEGCGQHRLEHVVLERRGLVHGPAAGHFRDRRGGGASPGPQVRGDPVSGEQFPVADQVDDGLRRAPAGAGAELTDHGVVFAEQVAAVREVCLAVIGADVAQAGDALPGEPVQEPGQLEQPAVGRVEVERGAQGARQRRDRFVPRHQHGEEQFFGDQPPSPVGDGGEVEHAGGAGHLDRQPDDVGEIPDIVVEQGAVDAAGQGEPCFIADVGTGEHRPLRLSVVKRDGGHRVASSGRRGSSSSWSLTWRRASATTASS